jgi:hypothetical protein
MNLRDEILDQPAAARRQLAEPVSSVVVAARGTSDHAAIYATAG